MVDTEIWLRLMSISSLYGDDMVRIAHWVAKQSHIDAVVLQQTGLTLPAGTTLSFISTKEYRKLTLLVGATQPYI
nr:Rossmann fold nucleotide-binding protein Smf [uncultured bacterium]